MMTQKRIDYLRTYLQMYAEEAKKHEPHQCLAHMTAMMHQGMLSSIMLSLTEKNLDPALAIGEIIALWVMLGDGTTEDKIGRINAAVAEQLEDFTQVFAMVDANDPLVMEAMASMTSSSKH